MNIKLIFNTIGKLLIVEGILLLTPILVSIIYKENTYFAFLITSVFSILIGFLLTKLKPKKKSLYAKDGFIIVGLSWIILSLVGSLPYIITKEIPNVIDAFFESVSAFTTTGSSIVDDVSVLSNSILFWRSLSFFLGGMGVLVFVLAILPGSEGGFMHILRAESPGPQVGKLTSKLTLTARILYFIYAFFTIIETLLLVIGKVNFFDAINISLSSISTGGALIRNNSLEDFSVYVQIVVIVFMFLGGINFTIFFLILIKNFKQVFKSEELLLYIIIIITSTLVITLDILITIQNSNLFIVFKDSLFQSTSFLTTTGFTTTNFNSFPLFSRIVLFILIIIGGCGGSTSGGLKISRVAILFKSIKRDIKKLIHPKSISNIRFEGNVISEEVVNGVRGYFGILFIIFILSLLLISIDNYSFEVSVTSVVSCLNNVGVIFGIHSFANYSYFSKIIFTFLMLVGRLEVFPIILLFSPKVWLNK